PRLPDRQNWSRAPNTGPLPGFFVRKNPPRFRLNFRFAASDFLRRTCLRSKIFSSSGWPGLTYGECLDVQATDGNRLAPPGPAALPAPRAISTGPTERGAVHQEI